MGMGGGNDSDNEVKLPPGVKLTPGTRLGTKIPTSRASLVIGDEIRTPGTHRSSPVMGKVSKIGRTRFSMEVPYVHTGGTTITLDYSISDLKGGLRGRNDVVDVFD